MKKWLFLLVLSLLLVGVVSCAEADPGTAVAYLNALNERDLETARDLVCDARQEDVTMGLITVADVQEEPFQFTNVSCALQAGDVQCRYNIEQKTEDNDVTGALGPDVTQTHEVTFEFEDGRICGFEEQVVD